MRALAIVGLTICLTGCRSILGIEDPSVLGDAAGGRDSPSDDAVTDGSYCVGSGLLSICPDQLWPELIVSASTTYATDGSGCHQVVMQAAGQPELCVMIGQSVTISAAVRATGSRPLVVVSMTSFTVTGAGSIDVSSYRALQGQGAGASTTCAGMSGTSNDPGAGGGAGGSFGTKGGDAGSGDMNAPGGSASSPLGVTSVRGGCSGGAGGNGGAGFATGGPGGGGLYLIAGTTIDLDGRLLANGAGGFGALGKGGGGGGGSGGLIGLDAPLVRINAAALVQANGAGGGGGAANTSGGAGMEPDPAQPLMFALGGPAPAGATTGGTGAAGSGSGGMSASADQGAGGGGGGGGVTRRYAPVLLNEGTVSPPFGP